MVARTIHKNSDAYEKYIKEKFELLQNNPYPVNFQIDSKKLQNRDGFRLRIGNYRFIYDVVENELVIYMEDADITNKNLWLRYIVLSSNNEPLYFFLSNQTKS